MPVAVMAVVASSEAAMAAAPPVAATVASDTKNDELNFERPGCEC